MSCLQYFYGIASCNCTLVVVSLQKIRSEFGLPPSTSNRNQDSFPCFGNIAGIELAFLIQIINGILNIILVHSAN